MKSINLSYCCEKVFTLRDIWMTGTLSEKEDFYSHLNMEDISDADYTYTKRVS